MDFDTFLNHIWSQAPAGEAGFEGLVRKLLERLTGMPFHLAASGRQDGRDMSNVPVRGNFITAECKRYVDETKLGSDEPLVKLLRASNSTPVPDIFLVVTTKRLSEQHVRDLCSEGDRRGISCHVIDASGNEDSMLAALCAVGPDVVAEHLVNNKPRLTPKAGKTVREYLAGLANREEVRTRANNFLEDLRHDAAGYAFWRKKQNTWLAGRFQQVSEARAAFSQDLAVLDPSHRVVVRTNAKDALDKWWSGWPTQRKGLAVLGEEGDGKSWAVCDWLARRLQEDSFPPTLFIPSTALEKSELPSCIEETIRLQLGEPREEFWKKRLGNWLEASSGDAPFLLLVLDGLNERPTFNHRRLFAQLDAKPSSGRIAVLATCRTLYWKEHLSTLQSCCGSWTLEPYNDEELQEALAVRGLGMKDFNAPLLQLLRKPRYFDLTVRLRSKLEVQGDITVERLIYEDWRDRLKRKVHGSPDLSHEDFQEFLMNISEHWRNTNQPLNRRMVQDEAQSFKDGAALLAELHSSRILERDGNRWSINPRHLALGLGLILADEVFHASTQDAAALDELTASWLEPQPDMDLKVALCGMAVLHSLYRDGFPDAGRLALFRAWLRGRNLAPDDWKALVAYLPANPELYCSMAEHVWSLKGNNAEAQEAFMRGFLKHREKPRVHDTFVTAFARWMGFVHPEGHEGRHARRGDNTTRERCCAEVQTLLGTQTDDGVFERFGYRLKLLGDEGQLRLGAVALAVISHMDRDPFAHALAAYALAGAAMGHPTHDKAFYWTLRTAPDPIESTVLNVVKTLMTGTAPLALRGAWWLLRGLGTKASISMAWGIPKEHRFKNSLARMQEELPCNSLRRWTQSQLHECLKLLPENIFGQAELLADVALDPSLEPPEDLGERLLRNADGFTIAQVCISVHPTSEDHALESIEPTLCAFNPARLASIWRRLAHHLQQRSGEQRWRLAMQLHEHLLALGPAELAALEQAWQAVVAPQNEDERWAETILFGLVLWGKTLTEQLDLLTRSYADQPVFVDHPHIMHTLAPDEVPIVEERLRSCLAEKPATLIHVLDQLVRQPETVLTPEIRDLLISSYPHFDARERGLCLHLFATAKGPTACNAVAAAGWSAATAENDYERYWGSRLLAECGHDAPFAKLQERIWLPVLGIAVARRGAREDEVKQYAMALDATLQGIFSSVAVPVEDAAMLVTRSGRVRGNDPVHSWEITDGGGNMRFVSWDYGWGGLGNAGDIESFSEAMNSEAQEKKSLEYLQRSNDRIKAEVAAGNPWFLQLVDPVGLADVARARPDLVEQWTCGVLNETSAAHARLPLCRTFFEALCSALLEANPELGVCLFKILARDPRCRVKDETTGIDDLIFALFAAPPSPVVDDMRMALLDDCDTSSLLFAVVFAAQWCGRHDFLTAAVQKWLESTRPYDQARACATLGFLDNKQAEQQLETFIKASGDCWASDVACLALKYHDRNQWARHWFERFLTHPEDLHAWAAFRLFLRCADRRFWLWKDEMLRSQQGLKQRVQFLRTSWGIIKKRILINEKKIMKLEERFLGSEVLGGQVWPWMKME